MPLSFAWPSPLSSPARLIARPKYGCITTKIEYVQGVSVAKATETPCTSN